LVVLFLSPAFGVAEVFVIDSSDTALRVDEVVIATLLLLAARLAFEALDGRVLVGEGSVVESLLVGESSEFLLFSFLLETSFLLFGFLKSLFFGSLDLGVSNGLFECISAIVDLSDVHDQIGKDQQNK
jgi:hypothetical protein